MTSVDPRWSESDWGQTCRKLLIQNVPQPHPHFLLLLLFSHTIHNTNNKQDTIPSIFQIRYGLPLLVSSKYLSHNRKKQNEIFPVKPVLTNIMNFSSIGGIFFKSIRTNQSNHPSRCRNQQFRSRPIIIILIFRSIQKPSSSCCRRLRTMLRNSSRCQIR